MTLAFKADHTILQGGFIIVEIPPELSFVGTPQCLSFASAIETSAFCTFEKDDRRMTLQDALKT